MKSANIQKLTQQPSYLAFLRTKHFDALDTNIKNVYNTFGMYNPIPNDTNTQEIKIYI